MFVRIGNTPRNYAWGSTTAIAELLGTAPSGRPEAELWLGAHAGSPSRVIDPAEVNGARDLAEWIGRDPAAALGVSGALGAPDASEASTGPASGPAEEPGLGDRLPFLLKVLAAAAPLSLQAHPSSERAAAGFAAENAAGVPLDSPSRNYKDPFHKPELIYALSDTFEALCGFRAVAESVAILDVLARSGSESKSRVGAPATPVVNEPASEGDEEPLVAFRARLAAGTASADEASRVLRESVGWLLGGSTEVAPLVDAVVAASARVIAAGAAGSYDRELHTVVALAEAYPGDPGIVLSLLLNRVSLRRGEALYLQAGNIHAYLEGLGVELMAASDNVLRGGLTPKHIDVPELLTVLEFAPVPVPYLAASHPSPGVEEFRPDVPDFALWHVRVGADAVAGTPVLGAPVSGVAGVAPGARVSVAPASGVPVSVSAVPVAVVPLPGPAIALCVDGRVELAGVMGTLTLARGEAAYVTPEEASVTVTGAGALFVATLNTNP